MSTLDQTELKLKPHSKLIPDKEWRININLNDIMQNEFVQEFVNNEMMSYVKEPAQPRKYNEKELARILGDLHSEQRHRRETKTEDFNAMINSQWASHLHPLAKIPAPDITMTKRENQLISMGIPNVTRTYYYRDHSRFLDDNMSSLVSLNDTLGDPLGESTRMSFEPVGIYTDYIGNLSSITDDIMKLGCDEIQENGRYYESDHLKYNMYTADYCKFIDSKCNLNALEYMLLRIMYEDVDSLKNHLSIIYRNEVSRFMTYDQLSYNSPESSDVSYVRFTLLI